MKKFLVFLFIQFPLFVNAQIKLDVYAIDNPYIDAISVYSSPGRYRNEQTNKKSNEIFYLLTIVDKDDNYFRVIPEREDRESNEYGFYGWVHRGDVYVVIQNLTNTRIPLYTNPKDRIHTGKYILGSVIAAVYDISGNYVLVHLIPDSDSDDISDTDWGWVHRCHLNGSIYTTDTRIDNIEY